MACALPFRIEPVVTSDDLAAARRLFVTYIEALGIDLAFQNIEAELATLPGAYGPPTGALLLARDRAGLPVGCVALRPIPPAGTCEMKRLFVGPTARHAGLGRALVEAVLAEGARLGHRTMRLDTLPAMTDAIALYRAAGFRPIPPYYDTPLAGTLFLERLLDA